MTYIIHNAHLQTNSLFKLKKKAFISNIDCKEAAVKD